MSLSPVAALQQAGSAHTQWQFDCTVAGLPANTFVVTQFVGQQSLSESPLAAAPFAAVGQTDFSFPQHCYGFYYQINLASRTFDIDIDSLVDQTAALTILQNEHPVQVVHGVIQRFTAGHYGRQHRYYSLVLVPALQRLALRHNMRIFQMQTAQQIVETLLAEMAISDYDFQLQQTPPQREFCVQYRQTDLEFIRQLAAEEGWVFHFQHQPGQHLMVFTDAANALPMVAEPILYHGQGGGLARQSHIQQLQEHRKQCPSSMVLKDYTFKVPAMPLRVQGDPIGYQGAHYEHYDWGRHKNSGAGSKHSQMQLEALRRDASTATGSSDHPLIEGGYRIQIEDEMKAWNPALAGQMMSEWTVIQVIHQGSQPQALEASSDSDAINQYHNQFTLIPAAVAWRPTPMKKPKADSIINGMVVGPAGEEIYCDEHGRVKVHFLWDRDSKQNEQSSPWIRVSQNWAGGKHGSLAIPRVGDEVLIGFLYDDPDQPIIVGRAYHGVNLPPRALPDNKTQSVFFKTKTYQGAGFNELRTEDKPGSEEIFLHGQKDFQTKVLNDQKSDIGNDKQIKIANDHQIEIGNDRSKTVGNDQTTTVGNDRSDTISNDDSLTVNHDRSQSVANDESISIGNDQNISIANSQTLNVASDQSATVGGNQNETIALAKAETIGLAKALTIGAGYQVSVGGSKNESVGLTSTEQVGMLKQINVGMNYKLACGASSLTLSADGTITLTGLNINITGATQVTINGETVDVN